MKKLALTLIVALAFCGSIFAQIPNPNGYETHWPDFDYHSQPFNKGLVAAIMIDGVPVTVENDLWDDFEVSAWVGDECRGVGLWLCDEFVQDYGDPYPATWGQPIYYRNAGEVVSFKMWDHVNGIEYTECVTMQDGEPVNVVTGTYYDEGWDEDPSHIIWLCFTSPATTGITKDILGYNGQGGYYLIASPVGEVNPDNVDMMKSNTYDLYWFKQDGDTEGKEWMNYKTESFSLVPGKGYLYANSDDVTLTFPGNAYEGTSLNVPLDYVADCDFPGMNLVGNPFNATAYIGTDFYVMSNDEIVPATTDEIAPMEGVFVCAEAEGESVTFSTTNGKKVSRLALNLVSSSKLVDRAVVNFGEGQLPKFQLNANSSKLYFPMSDKDYAVVSCQDMGELPLNFKAEKSGSYTLAVNSQDVSFAYLHLIDNLNGSDTDLLANPSYSFEASTADYASRFKLVFATGDNTSDEFAFFSNGAFVINNDGNATLQVVDVTGRVIMSESINGCANVSVNAAPGVYMIRLVNGDSEKVQKVIVK